MHAGKAVERGLRSSSRFVSQESISANPRVATFERDAERQARTVLEGPTRDHLVEAKGSGSVVSSNSGHGTGTPMDEGPRSFFEERFGHDFSQVRIHADQSAASAAEQRGASAFTVGNDIVFGRNQYRPASSSGGSIIAHELAHVLQQRSGAPQAAGISLQMQPAPPKTESAAAPKVQAPTTPSGWAAAVDKAVRTKFGLGAKDFSSARTSFVGTEEFAKRFPASQLEEHLLNIFLDWGHEFGSTEWDILNLNKVAYANTGWTPTAEIDLREFIREGIRKGEFKGEKRERDVATGQFERFTITPKELVAMRIAAVTDIAPPLPQRTITVQKDQAAVQTLVHEVCHFYIHDRYRDMALARKDAGEYLRSARIGQILLEGFAEYFARDVMKANAHLFGPLSISAYELEVEAAREIIGRMGGAAVARQAYFQGNKQHVSAIGNLVDQMKTLPVPPKPTQVIIR
ncbi:MAG: DUF4157 domain-containing protein [Verrucomicrobiales bacterium]|nr:DUF4157 domain-containing protein [Verrucomicrobiales bacterium]